MRLIQLACLTVVIKKRIVDAKLTSSIFTVTETRCELQNVFCTFTDWLCD